MTVQMTDLTIDRDDFVAWLRTKPPEQEFHYTDIRYCCVAQYLASKYPYEYINVGASDFSVAHKNGKIPDDISAAVAVKPRTFGNVLALLVPA